MFSIKPSSATFAKSIVVAIGCVVMVVPSALLGQQTHIQSLASSQPQESPLAGPQNGGNPLRSPLPPKDAFTSPIAPSNHAVEVDQAPPQLAALERISTTDSTQTLAPVESVPDWLIRPDLLSPLNSFASKPGDLMGANQERSQVFVLLVQPGISDQILTVDQLKQVAQQTRLGDKNFASPDRAVSLASYQEKVQDKQEGTDATAAPKPVEPQTTEEQELSNLKQQIDARRSQLTANESLETGAKNDALSQLNLADEWIQKATTSQDGLKSGTEASNDHEKKIETLNAELKKELQPKSVDDSKSQEDLNTELKKREADLDLANIEQKSIRQKLADLEVRKTQIPKDKKAAETALNDATKASEQLEAQPDSPNKSLSLLVLKSKRLATTLEVKALAIEATRLEQKSRTLPLERDLIAKKIRVLETEIKEWRAAADKKRKDEIDRQREEAIEALLSADPEVKAIAETNQALVAQRSQLTLKTSTLLDEINRLKAKNDDLEKNLTKLKDRITTAGEVTSSSGILLVEHRRSLPPTAKSQQQLEELAFALSQSQAEVLKLNEQRTKLINDLDDGDTNDGTSSEGFNDPRLSDSGSLERLKPNKEEQALESKKRTLKETQLKIIDGLIEDHRLYREKNLELEEKNRDLIGNVSEAEEFIDENALWVRSAERISIQDIGRSLAGFQAFFDRSSWNQVITNISNHVGKQPYEAGLLALVIGSLFVVQRRLRWSHE